MSAIAETGAMLLNGQERAPVRKFGRSLPHLVVATIASGRRLHKFLCPARVPRAPWLLLTGGLLVRVQP